MGRVRDDGAGQRNEVMAMEHARRVLTEEQHADELLVLVLLFDLIEKLSGCNNTCVDQLRGRMRAERVLPQHGSKLRAEALALR